MFGSVLKLLSNKEKKAVKLIEVNPIILKEGCGHLRVSPRPQHLKQEDYDKKFDYRTVAYDVFYKNEDVFFSGPPLLNLQEAFKSGSFTIGGIEYSQKLETKKFDRMQRNFLPNCNGENFIFDIFDSRFSGNVGKDLSYLFAEENVLLTLSKNNNPEWIVDWIKFYSKVHDVTAVLIYDNGSDRYSLEQLSEYLENFVDQVKVVIVSWPFLYGPIGGVWAGSDKMPGDSDFCQYGMLEHAKNRFLYKANAVINADIDELLVNSKRSIVKDLEDSCEAGFTYKGKWIESISCKKEEPKSFYDYVLYNVKRDLGVAKWTISPAAIPDDCQWKVHNINGLKLEEKEGAYFGHFLGINDDWKRERTKPVKYDKNIHKLDYSLACSLFYAFQESSKNIYDAISCFSYAEENQKAENKNILLSLFDDVDPLKNKKRSWIYKEKTIVLDFIFLSSMVSFDIKLDEHGSLVEAIDRKKFFPEEMKSALEKIDALIFSENGRYTCYMSDGDASEFNKILSIRKIIKDFLVVFDLELNGKKNG